MSRLKKEHSFTKIQTNWLDRIETYLLNEDTVLNSQSFEEPGTKFKSDGGFRMLDAKFEHRFSSILEELNQYLYDDGAKSA